MIQRKRTEKINEKILRDRINHFFSNSDRGDNFHQKSKDELDEIKFKSAITQFIDNLAYSLTDGDIYIFGGLLRDVAMIGSSGFASDVDIVVNGEIYNLFDFLKKHNAVLNKFGGFRLKVGSWPVDIWQADQTWAVKMGVVEYRGISSLLATTILNWDSILMNWRTKKIIFKENYFEDIVTGTLDIVQIENPNPVGMLVRVLKHMQHKNAKRITRKTLIYLNQMTNTYSFEEISNHEITSYKTTFISQGYYEYFKNYNVQNVGDYSTIQRQYSLF